MTISKQQIDNLAESLSKIVEDIRDGELNFATLKIELSNAVSNFKELDTAVKNDKITMWSMATRIALLEQTVTELKQTTHANNTGRWQVYAALAVGSLGLISSIVNMFIKLAG